MNFSNDMHYLQMRRFESDYAPKEEKMQPRKLYVLHIYYVFSVDSLDVNCYLCLTCARANNAICNLVKIRERNLGKLHCKMYICLIPSYDP